MQHTQIATDSTKMNCVEKLMAKLHVFLIIILARSRERP